jgi:copper homeostasis protein
VRGADSHFFWDFSFCTLNMPNRSLLEVCVESVDRAAAAERGGADRIELCGDLSSAGVTPGAALMRATRKRVHIPIFVLIRPRSGNFVYSDSEFKAMKREIEMAKALGMNGIVAGLLDEAKQIERLRTSELVKLAQPLPFTFHRAFDLCRDLTAALQLVVETGAARILASGGKARVTAGLPALTDLVAKAADRIVIMPGGSIRAANVERILRETGAKEIHSSLRTSRDSEKARPRNKKPTRESKDRDAAEFEARVRKVRNLLDGIS